MEARIIAGSVTLTTRPESFLSKSPPMKPSLWATYPMRIGIARTTICSAVSVKPTPYASTSAIAPSMVKPFQEGSPVKVMTSSAPSRARAAPAARASISKSPA